MDSISMFDFIYKFNLVEMVRIVFPVPCDFGAL